MLFFGRFQGMKGEGHSEIYQDCSCIRCHFAREQIHRHGRTVAPCPPPSTGGTEAQNHRHRVASAGTTAFRIERCTSLWKSDPVVHWTSESGPPFLGHLDLVTKIDSPSCKSLVAHRHAIFTLVLLPPKPKRLAVSAGLGMQHIRDRRRE